MSYKLIKHAQWATRCARCQGTIAVDAPFWWERGKPSICVACYGSTDEAVTVAPAIVQPDSSQPVHGERVWSERQIAVFDAAFTQVDSLIIDAVAGSGKTTTLVELVNRLFARWPQAVIAVVAFNVDIKVELARRMPSTAVVATFNGFWNRALQASLPGKPTVERDKVKLIGRKLVSDGQLSRDIAQQYLTPATQLVDKAKAEGIGVPGCAENTLQSWLDLIDRYDIEAGKDEGECIRLAQTLLDLSNQQLHVIDFNDQLYLSALRGVQCQRADFVMVDEAQDFNTVQRFLLHRMLKSDGRLIAVGDPYQSIYAFRGADYESMGKIAQEFACVTLPLDISYRCPQLIVQLAQQFVPHIQAHPDAPLGEVLYPPLWRLSDFTREDAVLCRNSAPLVRLMYKCLAQRIPVRMLGREVGDGLIALIKKMNALDFTDLTQQLENYLQVESARLLQRQQEEKAAQLSDKVEAIHAAMEAMPSNERTIDLLIASIEELFGPKPDGVLTCSTVHKSKGKEWRRVFILDRGLMPSKYAHTPEQLQQENNIQYVAYTRSQHTLAFIESTRLA